MSLHISVDQKNRDIFGGFPDVVSVWVIIPVEHVERTDEKECVYFLIQDVRDGSFGIFRIFAAALKNTVVAGFPQVPLYKSYPLRHVCVSDIRADYPDGLHGAETESAREDVRGVVVFFHDFANFGLGFFAHQRAVVDDPGYGGDGYAGKFRDIVNIHRYTPVTSKCKSLHFSVNKERGIVN